MIRAGDPIILHLMQSVPPVRHSVPEYEKTEEGQRFFR
jgi:hypothetical protein